MNKAITDGLVFMPPPFQAGLSAWSSGDGRPGSDTYAGAGGGAFVPADQDFGGCLEFLKTAGTQKVRFMGETPILPGCYLQVRARVKCLSGPLPSVRIAGWPGGPGDVLVPGLVMTGPAKPITAYGEVVEVTAIVGTGQRGGVNMVWNGAIFGHLGLDFTGANGGLVRVDDIVIEDVTSVFVRDMMAQVDVRDYGAKGDGTTNDFAAFNAADAAANGREVLVPAGTYRVDGDMTFDNRVRFEGTVISPANRRFILRRNFDYATYLDAFGNEEMAFRKAYQALISFADHESLDLGGRRISLTGPLDLQSCDPASTTFQTRRVIRNGQFQAVDGPDWGDSTATSAGTYSTTQPLTLSNVTNIANIQVGSLVTGPGVGREVYVRDVSIAQQRLTLSAPLFDAVGTQTYSFRRFKYLIDMSGYQELNALHFDSIDFFCEGRCSAVLMPPQGLIIQFKDCFFNRPKDRGITSHGLGCQGMLIDGCQFISNEQPQDVEDRKSIGFNANANDVKIRHNRVVKFRHFCVLGGSGSLIVGNHWFLGDEVPNGVRKGGIILTSNSANTVITGNYIDNNFVEWTNEHDSSPAQGSDFSFSGLTITGNFFFCIDVAPWFNWLVIKPYGAGHFIDGLAVTGNVFRAINGNITRIEGIDTTYANLDFSKMRNITFAGNTFNGIDEEVRNPASLTHTQSSRDRIWTATSEPWLPFRGWARAVESVTPIGRLNNAAGDAVYEAPYVEVEHGSTNRQFRMIFGTPVSGRVRAVVRMDNPL
jgi:hypothetical protein